MSTNYQSWRRLFLFCLGLFAGTAFCMKWMEGDFVQGGSVFTIIGLEISYPREKVMEVLSGLDAPVRMILRYHLYFDFAFMAGVYPGIAALCMMARCKMKSGWWRGLLVVLALLQLVAWGCDIAENRYLLHWIKYPVIGRDFGTFHLLVYVKWAIALIGAFIAIPLVLKRRRGN